MTIKIVALGGSLSQQSTSLAALRVALEGASQVGAEVELFDVRELELPMYAPNAASVPDAARTLCDSVHACQGMLWSSPLYHGTISGSFKNALDWLQLLSDRQPPYLKDKVIGLISTAGGTQGLQAVNTMEFIVRALRGCGDAVCCGISDFWDPDHFVHEGPYISIRRIGERDAGSDGHLSFEPGDGFHARVGL